MKKLLSLLLCIAMLLCMSACGGNADPTEPPPDGISDEEMNVNTPVSKEPEEKELTLQELQEYTYDADGNLVEELYRAGSTEEIWKYTYDSNGLQTESILLTNNKEMQRITYSYDENGGLIGEAIYEEGTKVQESSYILNEEGQVIEDSVWEDGVTTEGSYTYNEFGAQTEAVFREDGKETERYVNLYNQDMNLVTEAFYQNGEEIFTDLYSYDEAGNVTLTEQYSGGELIYRHIYAYNDRSDMVEEAYYAGDGSMLYRYIMEFTYYSGGAPKECYTYESAEPDSGEIQVLIGVITYDEEGAILSEVTYMDGEIANEAYYSYDDNGNTMEETYLWYTSPEKYEEYRTVYSYNSDGQLLEETVYEQGEEAYRYVYAYDENGMESERCRYDNGILSLRQISQYNDNGDLIRSELYSL